MMVRLLNSGEILYLRRVGISFLASERSFDLGVIPVTETSPGTVSFSICTNSFVKWNFTQFRAGTESFSPSSISTFIVIVVSIIENLLLIRQNNSVSLFRAHQSGQHIPKRNLRKQRIIKSSWNENSLR